MTAPAIVAGPIATHGSRHRWHGAMHLRCANRRGGAPFLEPNKWAGDRCRPPGYHAAKRLIGSGVTILRGSNGHGTRGKLMPHPRRRLHPQGRNAMEKPGLSAAKTGLRTGRAVPQPCADRHAVRGRPMHSAGARQRGVHLRKQTRPRRSHRHRGVRGPVAGRGWARPRPEQRHALFTRRKGSAPAAPTSETRALRGQPCEGATSGDSLPPTVCAHLGPRSP